jgi:hypothetical protein
MLLAVLAFTKGLLGLGNVHLHPSTTAKTNIQKAGGSTTSTKPSMNSFFTTDTKKKKYCKKRNLNTNPPWASFVFW